MKLDIRFAAFMATAFEAETVRRTVILELNAASTERLDPKTVLSAFAVLSLGCQSDFGGCGDVKRPSCSSGNSIVKRTVGYYESWSSTRQCQSVQPEDLNLNGFTHINFAFAFFDPNTFAIAPMDSHSDQLYSPFTKLKDNNAGLQTWISVGGWSFTDPGPTRTAFSDMSSSSVTRQKFINELIKFMDHYGFDGVDLDWEYPQADDRGGKTADKANYVSLIKEMRAAFGTKYGITLTLPTSYWYLQHFDLENIQPNVDWFNFMAYDLHGVWDAQSQFVGPYIAPHTNVTEIDMGLDLLWRAGLEPGKVVLGLGWYGRSFTLSNPSCNTPNGVCQFSGGAKPGPCSNAAGILDLQEIKDVIKEKSVQPVWDKAAAVKWITWDSDQWISYDDDDTFQQKRDFAASRCLGGTMVWAIDQVDQKADNGLAVAPGITTGQQTDAKQRSDDLLAGITCYASDCDHKCKRGTNEVTQMNGQPGKLSTEGRCDKNKYRSLCCDDGTRMGTCLWRGYRGIGLSCMGGCDDGETEVVQGTNNHGKGGDQTCTGGIMSYCCKGFKTAPSTNDIKDQAEDAAKAAAEAAAADAALDIAAKAFCRLAVPALLAPLEALEALIPIFGEIADIVELAATPALIQLCVKGVEKEGKAEFKVFGKKHTLSLDKPTTKPVSTRPPESKHTSASTSSSDSCVIDRNNLKLQKRPACRQPTSYTIVSITDSPGPVQEIACDSGKWPQACLNYASVQRVSAHRITCPYRNVDNKVRTAPAIYYKQHNTASWTTKIPDFEDIKGGCQFDEYPPAAIADLNDGWSLLVGHTRRGATATRSQLGRYVEFTQNNPAGNLFRVCDKAARSSLEQSIGESIENPPRGSGRKKTKWIQQRMWYTRDVFTVSLFGDGLGLADDGLGDNKCMPRDPNQANDYYKGFALLNEDPWFVNNNAANLRASYADAPNFRKRDWVDGGPGLVYVDANSSRSATPEELRGELGFDSCGDDSCEREIRALRDIIVAARDDLMLEDDLSIPVEVPAESTAAVGADEGIFGGGSPQSQPGHAAGIHSDMPRETRMPESKAWRKH